MKIVSIDKMRQIEAAADAAGVTYDIMMQNAGRATTDRALAIIDGVDNAQVAVLIGPGNNGGDGLVAGRLIAQESKAQVGFYLLKRRDKNDPNFKAAQESGLPFTYAKDDDDNRVLHDMLNSANLIIDALFGIGVRLPIKGTASTLLRNVNQILNERRSERPEATTIIPVLPSHTARRPSQYMLAVDCPSGLECDTGELDKNAIPADETVTFIAAKPGLFTFPGAAAVGHAAAGAER